MEKANLISLDYWHGLIKTSLTKFFVLHALRQTPSHAYQIALYVEELTGGVISPSEGTLYPTLADLEKNGYTRSKSSEAKGRKRKVYQLTRKGHQAYFTARRALRELQPILSRAIPDIT